MKRFELVETLKRVLPALSKNEVTKNFSNFYFDGKFVQAWDGMVALRSPCETEFTGGVRGRLLVDFLDASKAVEVEFEPDKKVCVVKAARAKLTMAQFPLKGFKFEWPGETVATIKATDDLIAAMKACDASMGLDPSNPALLGVTVEAEPDSYVLHSATNVSLTSCVVKTKPPKELVGNAFTLPMRFCELVLGGVRPSTLSVNTKWVEATYEDGTRLHSATISEAKPALFRKVLSKIDWNHFVNVPKGMEGCVRRALVVLSSDETQHTDLSVRDGKLRLNTEGPVGRATDYVPMDKHDEVEVSVRPSLLLKPLENAVTMRVLRSSIAFSGPNYRSLISVVGG